MKASILKNKKYHELLYTAIALIVLLVIWKGASMVVDKEILVPTPESTFNEVLRAVGSGGFIAAVLATLKRAIAGFFLALLSGLLLGMLGGFSKAVYFLLRPVVLIVRAVPTMAMILLALIWLESEKAPVLVGFVVIFPIIYEGVLQGIRNVDKNLIQMMRLYRVDKMVMIKDLYLPAIRPYLMGAMTAAIGLNMKIIIAAEVLSQPRISMGTSFQIEKANLNTAGVFAWSLITIAIAGVLEQSLRVFEASNK